jgi:membrane protease subunit HflK
LMLTGDLNVAVVEWIVQYRIKDPIDYLFEVRDVQKTIGDLSESAMRQIVGDRSVDEVLTVGRIEVALETQKKLQQILDDYHLGIQVTTVKLKDVNPPDPVKDSFNEVNVAKQDRETTINQAWEAYNKVIPRAKGEAEKTVSQAEGYAVNRVNRAMGDANKFVAVWKEYQVAKDVTKRRLYLETLGDILPKIGRTYILDVDQKGLLPLLSLAEKGGE